MCTYVYEMCYVSQSWEAIDRIRAGVFNQDAAENFDAVRIWKGHFYITKIWLVKVSEN